MGEILDRLLQELGPSQAKMVFYEDIGLIKLCENWCEAMVLETDITDTISYSENV